MVRLGKRWFLTGEEICLECGKEFRYTLSRESYLFWAGLCSKCCPSLAFDQDLIELPSFRIVED